MAIKLVVSNTLGMERSGLAREVCKLFGFRAVSEVMRREVEAVVDGMIALKKIDGERRFAGTCLTSYCCA